MIGHLTRSLGWTWATLIVAVLGVLALASVWWAWRALRREPGEQPTAVLLFGTPVVFVGVALIAWTTVDEWDWLLDDGNVRSGEATAPAVELGDGEQRFVIVDGSTVTYRVDERLAGRNSTAVGVTDDVAGEIAIDLADPAGATIGTIVVNVEAFTSDSTLRDKRIRHDFLESTEFPFATFEPDSIVGLPDRIVAGEPVAIEVSGRLTVKETTAPAAFNGWVRLDGELLTAEMSSTVEMSTYDVGPIAISGLVSTSNDVELSFSLLATVDGVEPTPAELAAIGSADRTTGSSHPAASSSTTVGTTMRADQPPPTAAPTTAPTTEVTTVEFSRAVQPIIEAHCASCHVPGGPGAATVAFATAGDVAEIASSIGLVTEARYMPPWTASDLSLDFAHDWSLSDDQIDEILAWIDAGGELDVDPDTELDPRDDLVPDFEHDAVIHGAAYVGSEENRDDYRCQVYELPPSDDTRWISGYTLQPDEIEVVHHGIMFRAGPESLDAIHDLEALDDQPGWECFGLAGVPDAVQIGGWVPGLQPRQYPEGAGLRMEPGDFLITQIHYHFDHDYPADESALLVDFADPSELTAAGGEFADVEVTRYLAHAEVPCRDDEQGPMCDRATVIADIRDRFGEFAARIPDGLIAMCGADLAALMADTDGVGEASCDHDVPVTGTIVGLHGHMHEFGRTVRLTLNPDTADERILLDVPNWSFEWQLDYRPADEIVIGPGDVIRIECSWDRSLAPMPEPRHITWNEGTDDEMCYSTISTVDLR